MMTITFLSDTHTKHHHVLSSRSIRSSEQSVDLPGGDILIHSGDFMGSGYSKAEAIEFFDWFDSIPGYETKILVAGNHDRIMQLDPEWAKGILSGYKTIEYLQDEELVLYFDGPNGDMPEENIHIYGSPWQPEFYNWAFNLPRGGEELKARWDAIPTWTDILITHGPAQTYLDTSGAPYNTPLLGCELLKERIELIRPKIHVCGHIHGGAGYHYNGHTHFFNASILNEQYQYTNAPITIKWNDETNEITWPNR
jgi:Icc-related predicted phosphoesterase